MDVDPEHIEPGSWRHANRTFGVDFTRRAVVRTFNLGVRRPDLQGTDRLAGQDTRIGKFFTCVSCGGTATDKPAGPGQADPLVSSGYSQPSHHRLWCPQRRGTGTGDHAELILAHVLPTEAIRVLLPVATALVNERVASFAAALMAGVAKKYGGDPDHLAVITATMPDQETGRRRQFLVLHDTLPGGTGYLHRLADQDELRKVLVSAREVIAGCRCADDGKRACHRCLLSHIDDDKWPLVSRAEALSMLDDLLQDWTTTSVASTREISLAGQVESELEARFWKALKDWAAAEPAVSLTPAATVNGRSTAALRTDSAHWQVTMHHRAGGTIPDVEFARTDQNAAKVVVYLDGYKYHASFNENQIAEDADKRAGLRADGTVVFQFDWEAVDEMADDTITENMPWPPYRGNAQARARTAYQKTGSDPAELPGAIWCNPVRTLFAYLADPDPTRWLRRAEAAVAGLFTGPTRVNSETLTERIVASLLGQPLPAGGDGPIGLAQARDDNDCAVTVILDPRAKSEENPLGGWTALTVLDDRLATISADTKAHRRRWAAWLYWGNIVQFLSDGAGDGDQIAYTNLELFDPHLLVSALKVANSSGLRTYYSLNRRSQAEATPWAASLSQTPVPPAWHGRVLAGRHHRPRGRPARAPARRPRRSRPGRGPGRLRAQRPGVAGGGRLGRPSGRDRRGRGQGVRRRVRGGGVGRAPGGRLAAGRTGRADHGREQLVARLRLTEKADKEIDKLDRSVKGAMWDFMRKFRQDPANPGLRLKQLQGDSRLYSARVSDDYRALMLHVKDDEYMLVTVKHRSESYDNLERYAYQINQVTGGIDVYDMASLAGTVKPSAPSGPAAVVRGLLGVAADRAGSGQAAAIDDREDHDRGAAARVHRMRSAAHRRRSVRLARRRFR